VTWEAVIGLEVHVQLDTRTKMFCGCPVAFGARANTLICPVCSGQPGALPLFNHRALRLGISAGLALGCSVETSCQFDRKSYHYPDLPKGYQITQWRRPLLRHGALVVPLRSGESLEVAIHHAHLEEDSGKLIHPPGADHALLDLNRAGAPLLEIVSGPDLRHPEEAAAYLRSLRQLLRHVGVSQGHMERGQFRCDVNISMRPAGSEVLGTRTEIKNLNSFAFVVSAIEAEIVRQTARLDQGLVVTQQTMAFDPSTGRTRAMRHKEASADYLYAPDPDLPPCPIAAPWVERLAQELPELPAVRLARYVGELQLPSKQAQQLLADTALVDMFEGTIAHGGRPRETARWLLGPMLHLAKAHKRAVNALAVTAKRLAEVLQLLEQGQLSPRAGRQLLTEMELRPESEARPLAEELDLLQLADSSAIEAFVDAALAQHPDLVAAYKQGRLTVLNALLGSVMTASRGKSSPTEARELLTKALSES
jgi:aspartyl-tRNA(Asn)/glutamyl-tRNA(Gln) amidotransferase subunit B